MPRSASKLPKARPSITSSTPTPSVRPPGRRASGPAAWERTHPGVRDRLDIYEHALEAATEQQAQRAVQIAVGRDPAVRVLGPRPAHPDNRTIWDRGAEVISAYRLAYDLTSQDTVLGAEPDPTALNNTAMGAARQALVAGPPPARDRPQPRPGAGLRPSSARHRPHTPPARTRPRSQPRAIGQSSPGRGPRAPIPAISDSNQSPPAVLVGDGGIGYAAHQSPSRKASL